MKEAPERFNAYITRYALSDGIRVETVELSRSTSTCIHVLRDGRDTNQYFYGKDWHRTKEEAAARAEEMRLKKIKSIKAQLAKLEKLKF